MSGLELARSDYRDWAEIAAAWRDVYERRGTARAKYQLGIAEAQLRAAELRLEYLARPAA